MHQCKDMIASAGFCLFITLAPRVHPPLITITPLHDFPQFFSSFSMATALETFQNVVAFALYVCDEVPPRSGKVYVSRRMMLAFIIYSSVTWMLPYLPASSLITPARTNGAHVQIHP